MKINLNRVDDAFHFEAENEDGKIISIDAAEAIGGGNNGVRPMQLLLMGLGGCSGIDVINILKKQRQVIGGFGIEIDANRFENVEPSLFENIHISFKLEGENLEGKKVLRAVGLSMEKYCSVTAILEKTAKIEFDAYLNGKKLQ
jgi:putative redox protein